MQSTDYLMLFHLQLFADGAAAGDGGDGGVASATGATAADAGQEINTAVNRSLEDLGDPKDKAEKYRARKAKMQPTKSEDDDPPAQVQTAPNGAAQANGQDAAATALDWDTVIKDPAINKKLQETITKRTEALRGAMKDLAPALELIGRQYGLDLTDMNKADFKALAKAVTEDDRYYEDRALEMGVDVSTIRKIENLESDKRRRDAEDQQRQADEQFRSHYASLQQQAAELQKTFPNFNLDAELNNPAFFRMTSPGGGLNVKQAYYALHADEITAAKQAETARAVSTAISNSIRAGQAMPQENGTTAKSSAGVTTKLYSQMTPQERAVYKQQLQRGQRPF